MSFLKFFYKEFKSDKFFNYFYVICLILGISGLMLVESFKGGIEEKVSRTSKGLIAGDISISSRQVIEEDQREEIESYFNDKNYQYAEWIETYSLISKVQNTAKHEVEQTKLASLNFVSDEFPFYGGVLLEDGRKLQSGDWQELHQTPILYLSRDLSWELKANKGDLIKVGEIFFKVDGIIVEDDFTSFRGFNLAPKVFISTNFLEKTELIKFGSTATYKYTAKLPASMTLELAKKELKDLITDKTINIRGPTEANQQISRSLNLLSDYLSLITLMTYLLSLVGLYYFSAHFLSKKIKTFNIYKSLGISSSYLFKVNFFHLITLTLIAVVITTFIVSVSLPALEKQLTLLVGESLYLRLKPLSLLRVFSLSIGGSVLALGPVYWGAMQVPVASIFQDLPMQLKKLKTYYFLPLFAYVIFLAIILSNSFKVGGLFVFIILVMVLAAAGIFKMFALCLDKVSNNLRFENKHAAKTLGRYFSSSFTIFICLLMGMTLTTFIFQLEKSIRNEFSYNNESKRPDLFVFDLQDSQEELYNKLTLDNNWNRTMMSPMIRARMVKINGVDVKNRAEVEEEQSFRTREEEDSERFRNRGVNLSYRSELSWSESIVKGKFNGDKCDPELARCEISLEQSYARRIGANIGDHLVYEISGIEVEGTVTSLRKVKWTSFEPNFFILFQPGVIDDAPKTFLSSIKAQSFDEKKRIFSELSQSFPTISILEVSEVIKKITRVFDLMTIAVKLISFLSLFVAFVVLVAVSFNHLALRKREMSLYYMMGVANKKIRALYQREFAILITLCFVLSIIFGSLLTYLIMGQGFSTEASYRMTLIIPVLMAICFVLYTIVSLRIRSLLKNKNLF